MYQKYKDSPRFTFISYTDRGHNQLFYSETGINYRNNIYNYLKDYFGDREITQEDITEFIIGYINSYSDIDIWDYILDEELFKNIVRFYDYYLI